MGEVRNDIFNVALSTYLALGGFGERWNGKTISGGVPGGLASFDLRQLPTKNIGLIYRDQIAAQIQQLGRIDDRCGSFVDGRLRLLDQFGPDQ